MRQIGSQLGWFTAWSVVAVAGPALAEDVHDLRALCERADTRVEVVLEAHEFRIGAYDAESGVAAVHVEPTLAFLHDRSLRLRLVNDEGQPLAEPRLFVDFESATVPMVLEALAAGRVQLVMAVRSIDSGQTLADGDGCTARVVDVQPLAVRLDQDDTPIAVSRVRCTLPGAGEKGARMAPKVDSGPVTVDEGDPIRRGSAIRDALLPIARGCLADVLATTPALQGALSLELHRSPLGAAETPRVVVDSVASEPLNHCLVRVVQGSTDWVPHVPPGRRVYVPLYFRGLPEPSPPPEADTSAELLNTSNAP